MPCQRVLAPVTGVGFQNSAAAPDLGFYAVRSYSLTDEAAEDEPALDPPVGEVSGRMVGPGGAELAAAVRAPSVVVGLVLGQDRNQSGCPAGNAAAASAWHALCPLGEEALDRRWPRRSVLAGDGSGHDDPVARDEVPVKTGPGAPCGCGIVEG